MFKPLPLVVMILSCNFLLHAQSSSTLMGARSSGMGHASSCLTDEWSVFNNIGGLAKLTTLSAAFTYDAHPSFSPFNKTAAVFAVPLKKFGTAGLGIYRFGDKVYSEQILTTGFSSTFGLASLGIKLNYIQYNAAGFGRKGVWSISFGGIAALTPKLSIGAYVINLNQPKISHLDNERLPTILTAGLSFKTSDKTIVTTELTKDLDYKPVWKTGAEYQVYKKFSFRTGFNIHPVSGFFGLGFKPKKFSVDYSYQYRPGIGSRHQATVAYNFNDPLK